MPELIEPMNATLAEVPAQSAGWASEVKWDGVRAIVHCANGEPRIQGRNLNDITSLFPEIGPMARRPGAEGTVLDGELVAFDEEGVPSLPGIQGRLGKKAEAPPARSYRATFVIFDLLFADGKDLRDLPYVERRLTLERRKLSGPSWQTPDYLEADIESTLGLAAEQGLEGLVVKRLESPYRCGESGPDWLKLKNCLRQEFVVGGIIPGQGLLVGYWDKPAGKGERLRLAGRVGSGFSPGDLDSIDDDLNGFARESSPFADSGEPDRIAGARFVNPFRVVEVKFERWTDRGRLVEPEFVGMRRDKDPGEVRRESPAGAGD